MTAIASISTRFTIAALNGAASTGQGASMPVQRATAASIVKLSPAGVAAAQKDASSPKQNLASLIGNNAGADTPGGRLRGLGAAMLGQLKGGEANVSESVQLPAPGQSSTPYGPGEVAAAPSLHGTGDDRITLGITTAGGVKVSLALDSRDGGLAVQMSSSGELSEDEQGALAGLAGAFQAAIDGMAQQPPKLDLAGLTQFDPSVLASVDLRATVRQGADPADTHTLEFHADSAQRSVNLSGPSGKFALSVDTGKLGNLGSEAQQARAMGSYLKQFDQAAARGRADPALMAMFKDAFTGMHSHADPAPDAAGFAQAGKLSLSAQDQSALTGLADFTASLSQSPGSVNPMRPAEQDSFEYQVAQSTSISGRNSAERAISQQQNSSLKASYHTPAVPGMPLKLDYTPESQNYSFHEINDAASSAVELGYREGRLVKAKLNQSSTQSARVLQYVLGKVVSDTLTPAKHSLQRDLLATLAPYQSGDGARTDSQRSDQRQQSLANLGEAVLLQAYPETRGDQ